MSESQYIWYKKKVAGPFHQKPTDNEVEKWITMVDSGQMNDIPNTEPLNEGMKEFPDYAHIIFNRKDV